MYVCARAEQQGNERKTEAQLTHEQPNQSLNAQLDRLMNIDRNRQHVVQRKRALRSSDGAEHV